MEQISYAIDSFIESYGWLAIAISLVTFCVAIIDIIYFCRYGALATFRLVHRKPLHDEEPAVSVIVPIMSENYCFIDDTLQLLLEQDKANYEVVVLYVGDNENFIADLEQLKQVYPHLRTSHISTSYPLTNKMVINVGIKVASNEHIIITTPGATPDSSRWLSLMSKGFIYGDIVVGYSNWAIGNGILNRLYRKYRFGEVMTWFNAAIRGNFIKASRHTLGFTKSLYLGAKGFNYLGYNVGEDDIFVRSIFDGSNLSVVITPNARVSETPPHGIGNWISEVHRNGITRQFYTFKERMCEDGELIIRAAMYALLVVMGTLLPLPMQIAATAIFLIRYVVVSWQRSRIASRLGESRLHNWGIIYDIAEPIIRLYIRLTQSRHESEWK